MYKRFLNTEDYIGIVYDRELDQLLRDNQERLPKAEEAAEASIVEYLTDNYEIETALEVGKAIQPYNPQITYPAGAHFYHNDTICEAMRTINGYKSATTEVYWELYVEIVDEAAVAQYSQLSNYSPGDLVMFGGRMYECQSYNGIDFYNIRIPGVDGWAAISTYQWQPNLSYNLWEAVKWEGEFYALIELENIDLTVNPLESDNWGLIGTYSPDYVSYEFSDHEYVVYEGTLYAPTMDVNPDALTEGYNYKINDPRNPNIKKHMLRLAVYELYKLISPNNMSTVRITDYEASIMWLRDASKMRINPQIPRKLDEDNRPVTDCVVASYMRDYDPNKNIWQI